MLASVIVALFSSSEWLNVNAVFTALPLLVPRAPEQWTLPSRLSIIATIAGAAPFAYIFVQKCTKLRVNHTMLIAILAREPNFMICFSIPFSKSSACS